MAVWKYMSQELPLRADKVIPVATALNYFLPEGTEKAKCIIWLFKPAALTNTQHYSISTDLEKSYSACYSNDCHSFVRNIASKQCNIAFIFLIQRMWSQRLLNVCIRCPEGNVLIWAESSCRKWKEVKVHLTKESVYW